MGKKINSKAKGNRVELEIARIFSKRFNETFRRVPASGAHGTNLASTNIREDAKEILTGDIITPKNFAFSIEVKSRVNFNFWDLLNRDTKNEIDSWLEQAELEAKTAMKKMLLIVKVNNKKTFVIYKKNDLKSVKHYDVIYKDAYAFMRLDYFLSLEDFYFFK